MTVTSPSIEDIKWLRDETGAGVMEARKALQDAGGDRDKAKKLLEQQRAAGGAKRAGRATANGLVESYIHHNGQIGVLVELDSETDFVARTAEFKALAREIALQVASTDPRYLSVDEIPSEEVEEMRARYRQEAIQSGKPEKIAANIAEGQFNKYAKQVALLEQPSVRDESRTIKQLIEELAGKTGENIVLKRFCRFQIGA